MSKDLDKTIRDIQKKFGEDAIFKLGSNRTLNVETIPTGSLVLDKALGVGGVPRGRVIEIYGPESSGKTTLTQHIIAEAQKMGLNCAFIDMEHALDPAYAKATGVDVENLYVAQPGHGEEALQMVDAMARSEVFDVIVVDSVAALVPKAEIEGEMGDAHVGLQARLMSQALRKLSGILRKNNVTLIFTNQIRMKIGVMFGNPETTSGGRALRFYASVRMDIRRIQTIKNSGDAVANAVRVRIKKNKVAPPFKEAEFEIEYGTGISKEADLRELGIELGLVKKAGAYYYYPYDAETSTSQGKENFKQWLLDNPQESAKLESEIRTKLGFIENEDQRS